MQDPPRVRQEYRLAKIIMKKSFILLYIAIFLILAFSVATTVKNRLRLEEELSMPEPTINPNLLHAMTDYEVITREPDDSYVIELSPGSDLPLAVYQAVTSLDGRPFKIICGDQTAEFGDGGCYCILNGETIPTLESLADHSRTLRQKLGYTDLLTPKDHALLERYHALSNESGIDHAAKVVAEELGISKMEAMNHMAELEILDLRYNRQLSPEVFRDQILLPVLSCQPGTAGVSLKTASASAEILDFVTSNSLRFADQYYVNRQMTDAIALLTEEEQGWLPENVPGVIDLVEKTLTDYEGNKGVYEDSGTADLVCAALNHSAAADDWARLKAAFDACIPVSASVSMLTKDGEEQND